jgi:quinol-cytochrome oxidoreductase complex cytochrome b subunit
MAVPTNPVHVLDLAFFLPAVVFTGVQLLRRRPFAFTVAPAFLVFLILTGVPILLTPVVQAARGEAAAWSIFVPIGTLTVISVGLLVWLLSSMRIGADRR